MNLLVIGNSPKLIRFVESIFPVTNRLVVNWRSLPLGRVEEKLIAKTHWDIMLVAGYDYRTASCRFEECLEKNVFNVIEFATMCVTKESRVIYANTQSPVRSYTYSRYLYAKMRLGKELAEIFPNLEILGFPTIIEHGAISTTGGPLAKIAFRLLDCLGRLSTVTINQSSESNKRLLSELKVNPELPAPKFLGVPRTLTLDRTLRLLLG